MCFLAALCWSPMQDCWMVLLLLMVVVVWMAAAYPRLMLYVCRWPGRG